MIRVQPAAPLLRPFAVWATAQSPKVRTVSPSAFGVPAGLFADVPEELLVGALVDGQPYVAPPAEARLLDCGLCFEEDGEAVHPHPECAASGQGASGLVEAFPGETLPELPAEAYGPAATALEPVEFAPLEDAPADEDGDPAPTVFVCPDASCGREFGSARGRNTHQRQVHAAA